MHNITLSKLPPWNYARSEAINMLCTNLSFSGENIRKIMITSCHAGEGKSLIAVDAMRKLAELYHSVVLVDADLRRSVMAAECGMLFEDSEETGLAHYLAGKAELDDVLYSTNVDGAYIVPVGRAVSNPLQLLNTGRLGELLDKLSKKADYVLVDVPPVGLVIDGAEIAKCCDGTLIVVESNNVHRRELQDVKYQLEKSGCPILGVALNKVNYSDYMSKKYYYKSYYSHEYYNYATSEPGPHGTREHRRENKR